MKSFKRLILFFLIFAVAAVLTTAAQETGGAKGAVCTVNKFGRRGIAQVTVTATQNGEDVKSATTNSKGEFEIKGLKAGKYDFVFKKDGFNTGTLKNVELGKKVRDIGNGLVLEVDEGSLVIIRGLVFDQEGHSIPGADILIEKVLGENNLQKINMTHSNNGLDEGDRGEFVFKLPEKAAKYRITATFQGVSASKEISVDIAAVYRTAITLNLEKEKVKERVDK